MATHYISFPLITPKIPTIGNNLYKKLTHNSSPTFLFIYLFILIGKQSKYIKSTWKRGTTYTQSIQVATKYKQKERETTNQPSKLKASP